MVLVLLRNRLYLGATNNGNSSPSQIGRYLLTRPSSLKPPLTKLKNPITILRQLDKHQWLMFWAGFLGWTWDAFDFFTVSLNVTDIAKDFGTSKANVSWGITVTLMLRSVGALIFGTIADRYGRKWPMIVCLFLFIILELATGFCNTLSQFLAVRSLYGIAMGGLFGPAAATALEDLPYEARGILSGLFEQGYATGYLLAAIFYRALVPTTSHGWRSLFWFGAGPPILIIAYRWSLPETNAFLVAKAERECREKMITDDETDTTTAVGLRAFAKQARKGFADNWFLFIYMVVLMSGFNATSHGSQDFYPTFLQSQLSMSPTDVTVITVVGQIGALIGACIIGYISTFAGRRLTMMTAAVFGGAILPAYVLPRNLSLIASAFFEQFFVGGIWGPIPIHLLELSPPALRSLLIGFTYQLGNLASSASATIQAIIAERYPLPPSASGDTRYDYGKVIGIFMGAVWAYDFFWLFWGPEMKQWERDEEAERAMQYERLRMEGLSLQEIGEKRAREHVLGKVEGVWRRRIRGRVAWRVVKVERRVVRAWRNISKVFE
ncbi:probable sugar transporter family protein [Phialocephala subalpina]|uniref:Probable sugar transporter family protein n=1 Tax=Phialocephala subalpina TaxID=576137 RepID=A0A1L7WUL4_9HELO|nr:probable sugar transporter family protein [Phialocephala subalpina]